LVVPAWKQKMSGLDSSTICSESSSSNANPTVTMPIALAVFSRAISWAKVMPDLVSTR
jgi:hypothetical protein